MTNIQQYTFKSRVFLILLTFFIACGFLEAKTGLHLNTSYQNRLQANLFEYNNFNLDKYNKLSRSNHPYNNNQFAFTSNFRLNKYSITQFSNSKKDNTDNIQNNGKPPLSPIKIGGELLVGTISGWLTSAMAIRLMDIMIETKNRGLASLPIYYFILYTGTLIGQPFGSTYGVNAIGNMGNETGSFWYSFLGSIVGDVIGFLWSRNIDSILPMMTLPTVGATIGFNMTRKYKKPDKKESAVLDFSKDKLSLNIPTTYYRRSPYNNKYTITTNILQFNF